MNRLHLLYCKLQEGRDLACLVPCWIASSWDRAWHVVLGNVNVCSAKGRIMGGVQLPVLSLLQGPHVSEPPTSLPLSCREDTHIYRKLHKNG